jgi:hypothetical protein
VPYIELRDLYFKKGNLSKGIQDTLVFKLFFKDGDGDLGSTGDSSDFNNRNPWYWAYNPANFHEYVATSNNFVLPDTLKWINYGAKKIPQLDTLPDLNCTNWEPLLGTDNTSPAPHTIDTVYITQNLRAFNTIVTVYEKVGANYVLYNPETDFAFPQCNSNLFRATFPNLSGEGKNSPLEGIITFRIQSYRLYNLFSSKTLKMSITIYDRANHASTGPGGNPPIKKDFTLQQITR